MIANRPPGETRRVASSRALVLAPHPDDEVLGCGGLVAELAAEGTRVEVLLLADGAAGTAPGEDPAACAARRKAEALEAARVLGATALDSLDLPDGRLRFHLEEAALGITRALIALAPDLVLLPSPLEVSADHQAAFAALHRVLAPLREEDLALPDAHQRSLAQVVERLQVLLYEVNRPLYPTLLVDVTAQLPRLRQAMECHRSQLHLHPYLEARLGLCRWRALSLPPEVEAAEAFCELSPADLATRSLAALVSHLGGQPERLELAEGPLLSVVVRTRDRPQLLAEALESLAASHYRRLEVVLVNDGGAPPEPPADFPFPLERLDLSLNRGRAGAAQAGVERARGDYVCFLDDDDLAYPDHFATLASLVQAAGVRVAYTDAAVGVYRLGERGWQEVERRLPYSRDFDAELLLLDNYIPFNTLAVERDLFAEVGPFDPELPFFEDWDFLIRLAARVPFHHLRRATCEYRHFVGAGHHVLGAAPRERADFLAMKARVLDKHQALLTHVRVAHGVDRLRAELVALSEAQARRIREARELAVKEAGLVRQRFDWEERYHRSHGTAEALNQELASHQQALAELSAEVSRLQGEEGKLRSDLITQVDLVGRLYQEMSRLQGEIARLGGLVQAMEGTRAWRLHQWWQGKARGSGRE